MYLKKKKPIHIKRWRLCLVLPLLHYLFYLARLSSRGPQRFKAFGRGAVGALPGRINQRIRNVARWLCFVLFSAHLCTNHARPIESILIVLTRTNALMINLIQKLCSGRLHWLLSNLPTVKTHKLAVLIRNDDVIHVEEMACWSGFFKFY